MASEGRRLAVTEERTSRAAWTVSVGSAVGILILIAMFGLDRRVPAAASYRYYDGFASLRSASELVAIVEIGDVQPGLIDHGAAVGVDHRRLGSYSAADGVPTQIMEARVMQVLAGHLQEKSIVVVGLDHSALRVDEGDSALRTGDVVLLFLAEVRAEAAPGIDLPSQAFTVVSGDLGKYDVVADGVVQARSPATSGFTGASTEGGSHTDVLPVFSVIELSKQLTLTEP